MGDRATIAFCAADGTEWARIYIHNRGSRGREVLEEFLLHETVLIGDGIRDSRYHQPGYLAARFVAWCSKPDGLGVGITPFDHEERWHWKVTCRIGRIDPPVASGTDWPTDWPTVEQVKPAEPIDATNLLFEVCFVSGAGSTPALPIGSIDRAQALRTAAWLAVLADPGGEEFAAVLEAVRST